MSSQQPLKPKKQDPRCPRQLEFLPEEWCALAVLRLKAIKHRESSELSEEEESHLRGCPWAIHNQMAGYCFFKYMSLYGVDQPNISDQETAHLLGLSIDEVKSAEKSGLAKLKGSAFANELKDLYKDEHIVKERDIDVEYALPKI